MSSTKYGVAAEELRENPGQWQAYESKGNCAILAGPGSGKTKTLTIKIARILEEEISRPQRLACITYSNECVRELRNRLDALGVDDRSRIFVSTIHSFALTEIVMPYAAMAGIAVPNPIVVASPSKSEELFKRAYQTIKGVPPGKWYRTSLDRLRRTVPDKASGEWKASNPQQTGIIEEYERLLLVEGLIDFDGLVAVGLQVVEGFEWVRKCLRSKYPVIVIDEYQDLGLPLHRMVLSLMLKAGVRIIAVGDPDQSIYGFTGAKPSLLRELHGMPQVEGIHLRLNYRCATQIIDASKALLDDPPDSESHNGRQGAITIYKIGEGVDGQARYALDKLVPKMLADNPSWQLGDIAFLYRSLHEGSSIAKAADELGFNYFRLDSGSLIKRTRLVEFLTYAAIWCSGGWKTGAVSLGHILKSWQLLRPSLKNESSALAARVPLIRCLFESRDGSIPLKKWISLLYKAALKEAFLTEPGLSDEYEMLKNLYALTKEGKPLEQFTVEIFANQGRSKDQINLITLHSSKGLEFEAVVMVGLEFGDFPSRYATGNDEIEEAARLFYVGVTRAKSEVFLLYAHNESPLITSIRRATV
jgi:ATP-dependent DNA helicase Rep/DNA helicase-2/ATP-dependent DNA helicase PcrA